ncbi:MAG: prefoldin subunit beta [Desulfurococcales archaeon ex4484_58]|nr:MAG: prefoldin subunit beta [Desulfurococcales archaeon ex4484_58]
MSQQKLPPEVQQTLAQYQAIRDSYLKIDAELKMIEAELSDIEHILETLKTVEGEPELYKMVGHILIKRTKNEVINELEERKEVLSVKKEKYKKQLEILEKQLRELESKLRDMLAKYGINVG